MTELDWEAKIALLELRPRDILVVQAPAGMLQMATEFFTDRLRHEDILVLGSLPEVNLTVLSGDGGGKIVAAEVVAE